MRRLVGATFSPQQDRRQVGVRYGQPNGSIVNWNVELATLSAPARNDRTRRALTVGDTVSVEGLHARSGAPIANA